LRAFAGELAGVLVREQQAIAGSIELTAERCGNGIYKIKALVRNDTPLARAEGQGRDEAVVRSLAAAHLVLAVRQGEFVSLLEPPDPLRALAAGCRNEGTWPVLIGEPGERDTMLAAPFILYDYPQIAPESAGDLFDATEIDEILTLRILALSPSEKQAMAAVDERARALLERTESLAPAQMLGLHGTVRGLRRVSEEVDHVGLESSQ
jgi:hydrogenase maturation protease